MIQNQYNNRDDYELSWTFYAIIKLFMLYQITYEYTKRFDLYRVILSALQN